MDYRHKKSVNWRVGYTVCCLVYVVWVVYLSFNNFDMVHREYRRAEKRLQPLQIEEIALQELVGQCRKKLKRAGRFREVGAEDLCRSWPAAVLAERQKAVEERLVKEKSRIHRKLVIFYISFGLVFLFLPIVFMYLLVSFFIWLYRNIKIVE